MNANELIEELKDTGSFFEDSLYLKAATMLRQQQEKIIKLETALQGWEIGFERMGYERLLKDKEEYITALLKEPTEEEILELTKDSTIFEYREFDEDMVRFARAILKKASEK